MHIHACILELEITCCTGNVKLKLNTTQYCDGIRLKLHLEPLIGSTRHFNNSSTHYASKDLMRLRIMSRFPDARGPLICALYTYF